MEKDSEEFQRGVEEAHPNFLYPDGTLVGYEYYYWEWGEILMNDIIENQLHGRDLTPAELTEFDDHVASWMGHETWTKVEKYVL